MRSALALLDDGLDRVLGRVPMYRVVTLVLAAIAVVYGAFTLTGVIDDVSTVHNLVALVVLLVASLASNRVLGLVWRLKPHDESAAITGLLLFFLMAGFLDVTAANIGWLVAAAVLANASKYVLAWRGRHVLNPAAAGALLVVAVQQLFTGSSSVNPVWIIAASKPLLPFVAVGALIVLWRTRRLAVGLAFLVPAFVLITVAQVAGFDATFDAAWQTTLYSFPIVFIAGFMLSEPLTLPPRRWQQLVVALVLAWFVSWGTFAAVYEGSAPTLGWLSLTPEVAIVLANLVAFAFSRRTGIALAYRGRRRIGGDLWELAFVPRRPVRHLAGQYLELHVPHRGSDTRGVRRVFSISSAPGAEELTVGIRVPDPSSSFKQALLDLPPGTRVHATGVHGDFVLPAGQPLLLVAGGIGVTPFVSQLRAGAAGDAVLVYGVQDGDDVPYRDEIVASGVPVVLVSPTVPAELPPGWTHVASAVVTGAVVDTAVPDASGRRAFVSGPPVMVNAVRPALAARCRHVHTDYFSGY